MKRDNDLPIPAESSKKELREQIRRLRREKSNLAREDASTAMAKVMQQGQLFDSTISSRRVHIGAYIPMTDEPNIMPLLEKLVRYPHHFSLQHAPRIWFPQTTSSHELFWFDGTDTIVTNPTSPQTQHSASTRRPFINPAVFPSSHQALREKQQVKFSWLFLPALAVDTSGNRLGQGGGYYDRFLSEVAPSTTTIACLYDNEIYGHLPFQERHDRPVDYALTPHRLIPLHQQDA